LYDKPQFLWIVRIFRSDRIAALRAKKIDLIYNIYISLASFIQLFYVVISSLYFFMS
ncbi:hypothetical protein L9F63_008001, partial [Diploptera punctata]